MAFENVILIQEEPVVVIILNRPQALNALNLKTLEELEECFSLIEGYTWHPVVIITGAGEKAFVAGADITELKDLNPLQAQSYLKRGQALMRKIELMSHPTIAAVNGYALGGGCELALACDLRLASENARFGLPEVNLGLIPGYGGTQRLPGLIGSGAALEMIMTGKIINAGEAYRIGLVNRVVPAENLMEEARKVAREIAAKSPLAVRTARKSVRNGLGMPLEQGLAIESLLASMVFAGREKDEGIEAFLAKRQPRFDHLYEGREG